MWICNSTNRTWCLPDEHVHMKLYTTFQQQVWKEQPITSFCIFSTLYKPSETDRSYIANYVIKHGFLECLTFLYIQTSSETYVLSNIFIYLLKASFCSVLGTSEQVKEMT